MADEPKDRFIADVIHEIRAPLSAIIAFANLLSHEAKEENAKLQSLVETIKRNSEYLAALVENLLDLSKIEAGKLEVKRLPTFLHHEIDGVIADLQIKANLRKNTISASYHAEVPDVITTDATKFRQILINIIDNAIKFTDQGTIAVRVGMTATSANRREPLLLVRVSDTGCGIAAEFVGAVFEPFRQGHGAMSQGGTGLGLTLSRRLDRILGGDVVLLHTELGKGSTFEISINPGSARH
jgi:signal transduction histidine kinase